MRSGVVESASQATSATAQRDNATSSDIVPCDPEHLSNQQNCTILELSRVSARIVTYRNLSGPLGV